MVRVSAWLAGFVIGTAIAVGAAWAQDGTNASGAAAEAQPPAADNAPGSFSEVFEQWKGVLTELRQLRTDYRTADKEGREAIEQKYNELIEKGMSLQPVLLESAEKAFKDQPEENPELVQFLLQVIDDHLRRDDYDEAYRIAKLMLDAGSTDKRLFPKAGVAAYVTENLDDAKKYLELARQEGTLDERGLNYLREFDEHRAKWNREKEIRAAEAKADDLPRVLLKTNRGDITIELFENEAPNAVANFISLVEDGFYDGLTFHRVLGGFMAQGGCPRGDGSGGPGYNIACECYKPEARHHFRGTLSMAHAGRDTGGSQFFLTFVPTSHLDGRHTVFGRVIEGMDVLPKLRRRDPGNPNAPAPDKIIEAKVLRKRSHPYEPKKVDKG